MRSDWIVARQAWVHLVVNFPTFGFDGTGKLIVAGYQIGRMEDFWVPSASYLDQVVIHTLGYVELTENEEAAATALLLPASPVAPTTQVAEEPPRPETRSIGTGFFIDDKGHVMTNNHVISGCDSVTIDAEPTVIVAQSESFDLAILGVDPMKATDSYLSFASGPARLNSDVTVAEYPLFPLLAGINVTRGAISAMMGLEGDTSRMQFTASVQPSNSGGPIVDRSGRIVGIVVSKLDAGLVQKTTRDIPQNVNFGIRGQIGQMFAEMNGIAVTVVQEADFLAPEDLADMLATATVLIECR